MMPSRQDAERLENDVYVGMDVGVLLETREFRGGGKTGTLYQPDWIFFQRRWKKSMCPSGAGRPAHRAAGVEIFTGGHKEKKWIKQGLQMYFTVNSCKKMLEEEGMVYEKMWTLKNAAVAVLGALFLGGICKLGIFFSVMLGISLFSFASRNHVGIAKERESSERFLEVCIYLEQMEGAYRKNRRIYQSLLETEMLFRDGKMKEVLQKAVREYEKEDAGGGCIEKSTFYHRRSLWM